MRHWFLIAFLGACLLGLSTEAKQLTEVQIEGTDKTVKIEVMQMVVKVPPQCQPQFCDSDDLDCDGILDQGCPGLEYDICTDGSIVDAYRDAAFSGICLQPEQPAERVCPDGQLVVSPGVCAE